MQRKTLCAMKDKWLNHSSIPRTKTTSYCRNVFYWCTSVISTM